MAITKTVILKSLRYTEPTLVPLEEPATLWLDYNIVVDDPDDADLPVVTHKTDRFYANSDVSLEEQWIQDIHTLLFQK